MGRRRGMVNWLLSATALAHPICGGTPALVNAVSRTAAS
jgi:hypothetical protein